jgi:anhydro-N-acetylmuramic acid kinase
MVIDQLVAIHTQGRETYDKRGAIAAHGTVHRDLIDRLLKDAFYREKPPKTAGREQFGREFIAELTATGLSLEDLIATATAFTPATIAAGLQRFVKHPVDELIVSGGGAHNQTMMGYLQAFMPDVRIRTSNEFGIDSDAKEAIAFAILAHQTWRRRPSNLPSATGAKRPVILGKISYR